MKRKSHRQKSVFIISLFTFLAVLLIGVLVHSQGRFGSACQRDFQSVWADPLPYCWDICEGFNDELDDTDNKIFYINMHGGKPFFETQHDQDYFENVHLVFEATHGAIDYNNAYFLMWDYYIYASSNNIRLGDEVYGLSILAAYSCLLHKSTDGRLFYRLDNFFEGGLRYMTGSHGTVWFGWTLDEVGEDFADELQSSAKIKYAWRDGISDWWEDQDISVVASGYGSSECRDRRDNMKWQNFNSYTRRRDGYVTRLCQTYWTDY